MHKLYSGIQFRVVTQDDALSRPDDRNDFCLMLIFYKCRK